MGSHALRVMLDRMANLIRTFMNLLEHSRSFWNIPRLVGWLVGGS